MEVGPIGRCNCGSNRCACVIKAGEGVTVNGTGRPDDPYVVTAESAGGGGGGSGFDPGDLKWTSKQTAPAGWLIANGQAVSRSSYAALYAAIGTLYGTGDGTTTFNIPDYTGRFMLGADATHPAGTSGGAETKILSTGNLPAHQHTINHDHPNGLTAVDGVHQHSAISSNDSTGVTAGRYQRAGTAGASNDNGALINSAGAHQHVFDTPAFYGNSGAAGNGDPFNIMPPYSTALPLIKT